MKSLYLKAILINIKLRTKEALREIKKSWKYPKKPWHYDIKRKKKDKNTKKINERTYLWQDLSE